MRRLARSSSMLLGPPDCREEKLAESSRMMKVESGRMAAPASSSTNSSGLGAGFVLPAFWDSNSII